MRVFLHPRTLYMWPPRLLLVITAVDRLAHGSAIYLLIRVLFQFKPIHDQRFQCKLAVETTEEQASIFVVFLRTW